LQDVTDIGVEHEEQDIILVPVQLDWGQLVPETTIIQHMRACLYICKYIVGRERRKPLKTVIGILLLVLVERRVVKYGINFYKQAEAEERMGGQASQVI
jgi:hypothetical protein